jgi:hypothetical protein
VSSPGQTTPGQTTPGQTTPGQTTPGQTTPGQTIPGQITPGQTTPGQAALGQTIPGQAAPGQAAPGQLKTAKRKTKLSITAQPTPTTQAPTIPQQPSGLFDLVMCAVFSSLMLKLFCALIFSVLSHLCLENYVTDRFANSGLQQGTELYEMKKQLGEILAAKSGIQIIYPGGQNVFMKEQSYARALLDEIKHTRTIKFLSIAGYENIGKQEDSLFFNALRENAGIDLEIILLSPSADGILNERIEQLQRVHPRYSKQDVKHEIEKTVDAIKLLTRARNCSNIGAYFYSKHPIFRLIIYDRCLFFSTYENDLHGHESPVYKITRVADFEDEKLSLYKSYENYFLKIKECSVRIDLSAETQVAKAPLQASMVK